MSIIEDRINKNEKKYQISINTNKITDFRKISNEFYKKFKNYTQIEKISLHIEVDYWDNTYSQ